MIVLRASYAGNVMTRFRVRENAAPLKQDRVVGVGNVRGCFRVRENAAPLKLVSADVHASQVHCFRVRENAAPLKQREFSPNAIAVKVVSAFVRTRPH